MWASDHRGSAGNVGKVALLAGSQRSADPPAAQFQSKTSSPRHIAQWWFADSTGRSSEPSRRGNGEAATAAGSEEASRAGLTNFGDGHHRNRPGSGRPRQTCTR